MRSFFPKKLQVPCSFFQERTENIRLPNCIVLRSYNGSGVTPVFGSFFQERTEKYSATDSCSLAKLQWVRRHAGLWFFLSEKNSYTIRGGGDAVALSYQAETFGCGCAYIDSRRVHIEHGGYIFAHLRDKGRHLGFLGDNDTAY